MLNGETIPFVISIAEKKASPQTDLPAYTQALISASLETVGFNHEEFAYREGVCRCVKDIVRNSNCEYLILDALSLLYLANVIEDSESNLKCILIDEQQNFAQINDEVQNINKLLLAGLCSHTDKYLGLVSNIGQAKEIVGESRTFELRRMLGQGPLSADFNYRMEYDPFWASMINSEMPGAGLIVWSDSSCNEIGHNGEVLHPYENSLPLFPHLHRVVQLPQSMGGWLFKWSSDKADNVEMVDLSNDALETELMRNGLPEMVANEHSLVVSDICVAINRNFCPKYYLDGEGVKVKTARLADLATKIQRGTSLTGKNLDILGTIYKLNPGKVRTDSQLVSLSALNGSAPIGLKKGNFILRKDDQWYIDNSCIQEGGYVEPKLISAIPDGQDRYTIVPEDGLCVLITRNGKGIAPFIAKVPTLVSDNLIIVRLNQELINLDYLSCIIRSSLVRRQIIIASKPLTKDAVGSIAIPILDEKTQQAIVARDSGIRDQIAELHNQIVLLEMQDSFDVLEPLGIEAKRRAWEKEYNDKGSDSNGQ